MASPTQSRASTEHLSKGLDRAEFKVYDQADRHLVASLQKRASTNTQSGDGKDENAVADSNKARGAAYRIRMNVKLKTDKLFHRHQKEQSQDHSIVPTLAPPQVCETHDDRLFHDVPEQKGPGFKDVVRNPVTTVRSALHGASGAKFAETMDNQVITHGAEVRLIRAYDEVLGAGNDEDKVAAEDNLEQLKKARQYQFVRWTMDRHVLKLRSVPPRSVQWPKRADFKAKDDRGASRVQWVDYGHHVGSYLANVIAIVG